MDLSSPPSCDSVYEAVQALHGSNRDHSASANIWLGEFQKSVHAWTICDQILGDQKNEMASYFAAQTMRSKIQCSFSELPKETYAALRDSLLSHLEKTCASAVVESNVITMQLCLALADLYLQVPDWTDFLAELLLKFSGRHDLLLLLLKVVPEENDSRHLRLGANRRQQVGTDLAAHTDDVINYLTSVCSGDCQNVEGVICRVFDCLTSWLLNSLVTTDSIAKSTLFNAVIQALVNPSTTPKIHDSATECVVQALYLAEKAEHAILAETLFNGVHSMQHAFHICVAEESEDKLSNFGRIFTELTESLLENIVATPGEGLGALSTLDLLLMPVGHHDYALAEMTFNVWYRLSELIYQRDVESLTNVFRPYITRLFMALHRHCRFDPDYEGLPCDNNDLADLRSKVVEVIKDTIFIPGSTATLTLLMQMLEKQGAEASWDFTESTLFIMCGFAHSVLPDENELVCVFSVVPRVIEAVVNLPQTTHVALKYTAVRLVGELNEWIDHNSHFIQRVLIWLAECVNVVSLGDVTSDTVEALCGSCTSKMIPHLSGLQQLLNHVQDNKLASENSTVALLRAVSTVISSLPDNEIQSKLVEVCHKQADSLAHIVNVGNKLDVACENVVVVSGHVDAVVWLDRLAAVFRQLPPPKNGETRPWLPLMQELWPLLLSTFTKFSSNVRTVEHCCRTFRFAIRSLGPTCLALVEPLVNQMVSLYERHSHSCILYLGSILVDTFGTMQPFQPGLIIMANALCKPTLHLVQHDVNALKNHPDTVDDYFRLMLRLVQRCPVVFLTSESCEPTFLCAVEALALDHREAHYSCIKFIVECFDYLAYCKRKNMSGAEYDNCCNAVGKHGQIIVTRAINNILFKLPKTFDKANAEVLLSIANFDDQCLGQWLRVALETLPHSSGLSASLEQLQTFHRRILACQNLREGTNALRDLIVLYR